MDVSNAEHFKISKPFLSFLGLWPYQTSFTRALKASYSVIGLILMCLPMFLFTFKHWDDVDSMLELLPTMTGGITSSAKFISLFYHFKNFEDMLRRVHYDLMNLISKKEEQIIREYTEITWKLGSIYGGSIMAFLVCFALMPLVNPLLDILWPLNETRPKKLVHPAEMLIDHEKYYYTILLMTYCGYVVSTAVLVAADTTYFMFVSHACALFNILSYHLENLVQRRSNREAAYDLYNPVKPNNTVRQLIRCIVLHKRIKQFIKLIDITFAVFLFFEVGLGFLMHCTLCVMTALRFNETSKMDADIYLYCVLVLCQTCRLFLHGWVGQQITDHSINVYMSAYNGAWYEISNTAKKMLLMLLARSQAISQLMVVKAFVINLENFTVIMKTSVSYCMVMLQMREEAA